MHKSEAIARTAQILNENGLRKTVRVEKRILKVTDATKESDEKSIGKITIQPKDKLVRYTADDVGAMLEAFVLCVQEANAHGESVSIKGLGTFDLHHRKARRVKLPGTDTWVDVPERYVPKFYPNYGLRHAAHLYTMSLTNNPIGFEMPDPVYDQFEFPEEDEMIDETNEIEEEVGEADGRNDA